MISQNTLKYGFIAALVNIVIAIILYMLGPSSLGSGMFGGIIFMGINLIVTIIVLSILGARIRKDEGGLITFKKMFINLLVMVAVMLVVGSLFGYLLYGVIDPEWMEQAKEMALENMYQYKDQMPEASFEDTIKRMEDGFDTSLGNTLKQLLGSFILWTIFSLILAAILKKKEPDFAE
ncbi:DUF4199 domain-containing protein [Luteibaculum oceani]|uniref:DUF4199 domain-containing protein n=1 Tax=Luteibaculum oceani TaxID=1294296 RepID=A0A5C6VE55_9FLAO|nr:DUF4199 domain-containing protein [Luteibaculum oceani]TXC82055.1 DUF4199 domain-containing protein [Luteibaculum oceani]